MILRFTAARGGQHRRNSPRANDGEDLRSGNFAPAPLMLYACSIPMHSHSYSSSLVLFLYLQVLDVLTTLVGFSVGGSEASPFVSALIRWGPLAGTLASKLFAFVILAGCFWLRKLYLLRWINVWYAALAAWNLCIVLRLLTRV
jgi:hypothetical protein